MADRNRRRKHVERARIVLLSADGGSTQVKSARPKVIVLVDALHSEGAENVAVNTATCLKRRGNFDPLVCVTRHGGVLESVLEAQGVPYAILHRKHIFAVHKFLPLRQLLKNAHVRLIHAHKFGSNLWGGLIGLMHGVPVIAHFHGEEASGRKLTRVFAVRLAGYLSRKVISVSHDERRRLIEQDGFPPNKVVTIYNGIEVDRYHSEPKLSIRDELGIPHDAPVIGIVAAFRPEKNHRLFVHAASRIARIRPDAFFLLVGDGVERVEMMRLARRLDVAEQCRFTGLRGDVPDLLTITDVGVLTSHREGLPLVLLEYMAASMPVVATAVGGMAEVVEDQECGYLVPADDDEALAARILDLISDGDRRRVMGGRGRIIVETRFSKHVMMDQLESLYQSTIDLQHGVTR